MCTSLGQNHPDGSIKTQKSFHSSLQNVCPSVRLPFSTLSIDHTTIKTKGNMLTLGGIMKSRASIGTLGPSEFIRTRASINQTDLDSPLHQNSLMSRSVHEQFTERDSVLICVLTWGISCPKLVHEQSMGRTSVLIYVQMDSHGRSVCADGQPRTFCVC